MARGGFRPGAGRPQGCAGSAAKMVAGADDVGLSPLAFLLSVMRDPTASPDVRMRAAGLALPYCHVKADAGGKKEQAAAAAATAEAGTDWETLLAN